MAPKHAGGATVKGKQAAVQAGQFLQFLRAVGYKDELPPSTVAWLESAPVFRFLASRLSHDNFVSAEDQQEYNELMLARGADASLYDTVEGLDSDADDDSCTASTRGHKNADPFLAGLSDEEVSRMLESEEAYAQQLEQQLSAVRAAAGLLESTTQQQAQSQGPMYFALRAHAANKRAAVKLDAQQLADGLDSTLRELEAVCGELCAAAGQPHLWLLCAADHSSYRQVDDNINAQHLRGAQVLDVCDVALELHQPHSPTGLSPLALAQGPAGGPGVAAAAAAALQVKTAGPGYTAAELAGFMTPRGGQNLPQTPRGQHNQGTSLAAALAEAKAKRRAVHAQRNAALSREMARQQHAFNHAYQCSVEASVKEQGIQAQLTAVQQIRSRSGGFGSWLSKGPSALQELQQLQLGLQATKQLLQQGSLKQLIQDLAAHNDCHIVVGDYDRHLAKVSYAMERKTAMLQSLLQRASLHLLLLLLCMEELRRLTSLAGELQGCASLAEGLVATTQARVQRCSAAVEALQRARGLSNLQADDTFLVALLAAAEGSLQLPEQQPLSAAQGVDPSTPRDARLESSSAPVGMFTPSYAPTADLVEKLQGLSESFEAGTDQLQKLLDLLPAELDQHKAAAVRLHNTAFPPGQPAQAAASSIGGSTAPTVAGSTAGSTWGGSQSAPASMRSVHSTGSGTTGSTAGGQHPQLLLTLPRVAECTAAVESSFKHLMSDAQRAINKQNESVRALSADKDKNRERQVMAKFFTAPEDLSAELDNLRAELQRQQLNQALSF